MKHIYEAVLQKIYLMSPTEPFEGCHKHRIIPGYEGGTYDSKNVVYLSQKQHSLVHWLRWKLFRDTRDRRGYKMIGIGPSGLSYEDRVNHGLMCRDKGIGMHSLSLDKRQDIGNKTFKIQKEEYELTGKKNFFYWSTKEGRRERASLGGKTSYKTNEAFLSQQSAFKDQSKAKLYGAMAGKKQATNGIQNKRFKTDEERNKFILENIGWRIGTTRKSKLGM
jgi:hypothetical protein